MYHRIEEQEILNLLRKIDAKLDSAIAEKPKSAQMAPARARETKNGAADDMVDALTQMQYEVANELSDGIEKLQRLVRDGQKHICKAKGKYQE